MLDLIFSNCSTIDMGYITVNELAKCLFVSKKTIYRKLEESKFKYVSISGYYLIEIESLKKFLSEVI